MSRKRKIAIFTGNRAEYGLQFPIIKAINAHPDLEGFLFVGGAHLDEDFGATKSEIERDGFTIHAEVKMTMHHDTLAATAQAIGTGIVSLSESLDALRPDFFVVYADRFEGLAAVVAGTQMGIPTAHIEGGDITEGGALDDSVRHAMTKLAHLHFTTNEEAAERVRKLGEEPWRVHNVGFPALDLIAQGNYASPEELRERYGLDLNRPVVIFTQHSVTTEFEDAAAQVRPALAAMRRLAAEGVQVILTYPNNDAGGKAIIHELERVAALNLPNIQVHKSLGRRNYHGVLNLCGQAGRGVYAGNSSSGIKETAIFGCPVVNIGSRQQGRLRADNVVDTGYDEEAIHAACTRGIFDDAWRAHCAGVVNPYGSGNAGPRIADILATIDLGPALVQKKMTY
ncbi:MAG: UDP-N-acetylglucosamine 2-epimerase [Humidesulfovibrio sp.]|jgi:UDP-N-acetylglucosamine 2-epimerase (non-hydrolysing)/GDP/UDP-N,N'-diacetylbacillosamine 2-epimerase (hydrolysing)|nr:UDP-N-acetylglucosamine 2-epimerase [Humidesulfovibrio sp.]PKN07179.1 MAG: UDP-N-acetylglucosamine 2-epimerase (hydrolyzing) [Deltaproteobacteria bacterium HGW-Deltaproteobacteria-8]